MDITYGINFSYTTSMTSQWIITQYCRNVVRKFCIKNAIEKLFKDKNGMRLKESPMVCGWKTHNSLDKNHIQPQTMGEPLYTK